MAKRLNPEEKRELIVKDLINKMFEIAGHDVTYDEIKDRQDDWYTNWTMTESQNKEWVEWGVIYLKKNLRLNEKTARTEMILTSARWGLKFSDFSK